MPSTKASRDASTLAPDLEIIGDEVRIQPTGFTADPEAEAEAEDGREPITERRLVRQMGRFRENPFEFLREISLFVSGTGWRAYDNFIGQPIFYTGFSEKMKADVLKHSLLQAKITELAELRTEAEEKEGLINASLRGDATTRRKNEIVASLHEVVDGMIDGMICKMESNSFIRGAYYMCTQLLTRAYHQGKRFPYPLLPSSSAFLANT